MAQASTLDERRESETVEVWRRRFHEAQAAGLSLADSQTFAASQQDIGMLRKMVANGWTATQIAKILF